MQDGVDRAALLRRLDALQAQMDQYSTQNSIGRGRGARGARGRVTGSKNSSRRPSLVALHRLSPQQRAEVQYNTAPPLHPQKGLDEKRQPPPPPPSCPPPPPPSQPTVEPSPDRQKPKSRLAMLQDLGFDKTTSVAGPLKGEGIENVRKQLEKDAEEKKARKKREQDLLHAAEFESVLAEQARKDNKTSTADKIVEVAEAVQDPAGYAAGKVFDVCWYLTKQVVGAFYICCCKDCCEKEGEDEEVADTKAVDKDESAGPSATL